MTATNQSAKAKLFATYWGQKVLRVSEGAIVSQIIDGYFIDRYKETGYLQLRSIADLTDEEAKSICNNIGLAMAHIRRDHECIFITDDTYFVGIYYTGIIVMTKGEKPYWDDIQRLYESVRSFGIALPVTILEDGKPVTYSVERQVELKWIKINQPK